MLVLLLLLLLPAYQLSVEYFYADDLRNDLGMVVELRG